MDAAFGAQPTICVLATDAHGGALDARFLAGALLDELHLAVVRLGPAQVHAQQHLGPVLALGAAGAGMDLEKGVVAVGLAREQGLELDLAGPRLQAAERDKGLLDQRRVVVRLGEVNQLAIVGQLALGLVKVRERPLQPVALAHQRPRLGGIAPQAGILGAGVQRRELRSGPIGVKGASSAASTIARSRRRPLEFPFACPVALKTGDGGAHNSFSTDRCRTPRRRRRRCRCHRRRRPRRRWSARFPA